MELVSCEPGRAVMRMTVRALHLNGHQICHGGFIFTLSDSTFAFACNSYNKNTRWPRAASIEFLKPGHLGDVLTCEGVEQTLQRAPRHLRHESHQSARAGHCPVPRQERPDSGHCDSRNQPPSMRHPMKAFLLEPIEKASIDELRALQLKRLKSTLAHAYANSPVYKDQVRRCRSASRRPQDLVGPGEVSFYHQEGPARQLPLRHVRRAAREVCTHPCVQRHHRQAHGGRLHAEGHRHLGRRGGPLDPRGRRAPRHDMVHVKLRLRPVHRRAGCALRRGEAWPDGGALWRRAD